MIAGNEGVSILIYGQSGIGKSTDVGYALRKAAWLQTEPGGLIPVVRCVGYTPQNVITLFDAVNPERELRNAVDTVLNKARSGHVSTIVLDTGSEITERMVGSYMKKNADGRMAYGKLMINVIEIVQKVIAAGVWFVCICHELPPEVDERTGNKLRGGPLFPGKKLPRSMPPKFDLVLRATTDKKVGSQAKRVYRCDPLDGDYIMKDRFGVTREVQPMELAPIVFRILHPGKEVPPALLEKKLTLSH